MQNKSAIKKRITEQIENGIIRVNSIKNFKQLIKLFSSDAHLLKSYADFLSKNEDFSTAAQLYHKATISFINSGSMIDAVSSKIRQWKIVKPAYQDARLFFSTMQKANFLRSPLYVFFSKLSSPEIFAIMMLSSIIELSPGQSMNKFAETESNLNFVVKGKIRKIIYEPQKENNETIYKKSSLMLTKNQFFGKILPFDKVTCSQSYFESEGQVELITIPKKNLKQICKKYQNVETALKGLYEFESIVSKQDRYKQMQKGERYKLPIKMSLEIYPETSFNYPIIVEGYSKDISIGGTCFILNEKDMDVHASIDSFHKNTEGAKVKISMNIEALKLKVSGSIVWSQKIYVDGKQTLALGLKFDEMSPKFQGMLFAFADNLSVCD
jgi:hypothetical protein